MQPSMQASSCLDVSSAHCMLYMGMGGDGQLVLDIYEVLYGNGMRWPACIRYLWGFWGTQSGSHACRYRNWLSRHLYFCTYLERLNSCVGYFESVWDFVKLPYEVDSISSSSSIEHFISIFNGPFTKMK